MGDWGAGRTQPEASHGSGISQGALDIRFDNQEPRRYKAAHPTFLQWPQSTVVSSLFSCEERRTGMISPILQMKKLRA